MKKKLSVRKGPDMSYIYKISSIQSPSRRDCMNKKERKKEGKREVSLDGLREVLFIDAIETLWKANLTDEAIVLAIVKTVSLIHVTRRISH